MSKADWYSALNDYGMVYSGKYIEINDPYEDDLSEDNDENRETNQDININVNHNTNNSTADNVNITSNNNLICKINDHLIHIQFIKDKNQCNLKYFNVIVNKT